MKMMLKFCLHVSIVSRNSTMIRRLIFICSLTYALYLPLHNSTYSCSVVILSKIAQWILKPEILKDPISNLVVLENKNNYLP